MKKKRPDPDWYDYEEKWACGGIFGGTFAIVVSLEGRGGSRTCSYCGKEGDIYMWVTQIGEGRWHGADHTCCCLNTDCERYWRKVLLRLQRAGNGLWMYTKVERRIWDDRAIETWNNLYG